MRIPGISGRRSGKTLIERLSIFKSESSVTDLKKLEWLYRMLDILDNKAAALMQFNAIILAVAAILLDRDYGGGLGQIFLILVIAASLVSSGFGFFVVKVGWLFLEKAEDVQTELKDIETAIDCRTRFYQWSWRVSAVSIVLLAVAIALSLNI